MQPTSYSTTDARRASRTGFSLAAALLLMSCVSAQALTLSVTDQHDKPLANAVVELVGENPAAIPTAETEISQDELMFAPWVSAIPVNSLVHFPNRDKTRHHVYSFSPAKIFEIKLYADTPEEPVTFDQSGIVVLGCNIHDHMQAYIYIGESPLLAVTDSEGRVQFDALTEGQYQLKLWHPWQNSETDPQAIQVDAAETALQFSLPVTEQPIPEPPRRGFGKKYR